MESLQLPQDLYWDGKMEPYSPSNSEIFSLSNSDELWLFEDNFAKDVLLENEKPEIIEEEIPSDEELLYEFEYDIKQEQWVDGKPDGPPLIEYVPDILPQPLPTQIVKVQNPYEIIMELEKIYGSSELTQLTPPQTPPQNAGEGKEIFNLIGQTTHCSEIVPNNSNLVPIVDTVSAMSPVSSNADYSSDSPAGSPMSSQDIARDIQLVDEILRTRAKDLPDWTDDESSVCSMSSSSQSQSNDDDWSPSSSPSSSASTPGKAPGCGANKRRVRPYGRGVEDKKSRKKEQNKNAATRYRQKKKQEMEEILDEERQLANRNEELQKNVAEIQREIKYLKQLIKEFHGNKKLRK